MECVLQWLDDLDDLVSAAALLGERVRRAAVRLLVITGILALSALVALLALYSLPLALALVCLLTVTLLYRGTVAGQATRSHS